MKKLGKALRTIITHGRGIYTKAAVAAALTAGTVASHAQWDTASGTNAIDTISDTVQYGGSVLKPIVVGILVFASAIGIYKRVSRKAGVSS